MRKLRAYIASNSGKLIFSLLLIGIVLNNTLIPEMERFQFMSEIENNSAGLIEILVENAVDSDLFETDEHDDSSDNLVDSIQKFVRNNFELEIINYALPKPENQSLYTYLKLTKGFLNIDTPPPKGL